MKNPAIVTIMQPHKAVTIAKIPAKKLFYDLSYQRDPIERLPKLRRMANNFNLDLFDPLEVVQRADGMYAIVDGAGRFYLATEMKGWTNYEFTCHVHVNIKTVEEEARLFRLRQEFRTKLNKTNLFKSLLREGEEETCAIMRIVENYNMTINDISSPDNFRTLYRCNILKETLFVTRAVWPSIKRIWAYLYNSIGMFMKLYEGKYDIDRLIKVLESVTPKMLDMELRSRMPKPHPQNGPINMCLVLVDLYNKKLREENRLDEKTLHLHLGKSFDTIMGDFQ